MFTTCPACQTVFRVTAATLRAAHGQVRCATCNTTFDALFGLSDEPPPGAVGSVRSLPPPVETPAEAPVEKAPAAAASPTEAAAEPADELVVDNLPANPSLDQVAAALADAGVLLEELDDPSALDEVTLVHIPGDPYPAMTAGTPSVVQALAEDAARNQRRAAMEAPVQALPATQVDLDDDAPTGTWAPLNLSAKVPPAAEPQAETGAAPASFAATLAAVSTASVNPLQNEPWFTNEGANAVNADDSSVDINGGLDGGLNGGMGEAAVEADAEEALEPWMDETQPSRRLGWAWTLGSVALLLVLAAQTLHHWREPLARHPTLGSGVIALYAALGQPLSPALNLLAYTVTEGRVDAAAEPGALRVSAIITNRTGKPQARPLLQVTLEDRYGAPIGRRAFHPEEYVAAPAIGTASTGTATGMSSSAATAIPQLPPRGVLPVAVEVADPGNEAVGFKLDICIEAEGVLHCASDPVDGSAATTP